MENSENLIKSNKHFLFYALVSTSDETKYRYIGTTSVDLKSRLRQHRYCAKCPEKRGLPVHKWMYSQYEKGFDIKIILIDECEEDKWEETEQELIAKYKELGYPLLNIDKGGKGVITKEKRSKSSLERSAEIHRKPVIQLSLNGEYIKEYCSVREASKQFDGTVNNIYNVLRGITKSAFNYLWVYKDKYNPDNEYILKHDTATEKVSQFDRYGNLICTFNSKKEAINKVGGSYNGISTAVRNKSWYKNSYWSKENSINIKKYIDPFKYKIYQNNLLVADFILQKDAAKFVGIAPSNLKIRLNKGNNITNYNNYTIKLIN